LDWNSAELSDGQLERNLFGIGRNLGSVEAVHALLVLKRDATTSIRVIRRAAIADMRELGEVLVVVSVYGVAGVTVAFLGRSRDPRGGLGGGIPVARRAVRRSGDAVGRLISLDPGDPRGIG
jgi:hypothetical protein